MRAPQPLTLYDAFPLARFLFFYVHGARPLSLPFLLPSPLSAVFIIFFSFFFGLFRWYAVMVALVSLPRPVSSSSLLLVLVLAMLSVLLVPLLVWCRWP